MSDQKSRNIEMSSAECESRPQRQRETGSALGLSEVTENKLLWRQLAAELVGTALLTALGVASCISAAGAAPQLASVALAFGLLVATIVQSLGHVSGGHINPAVSLGLVAGGSARPARAMCYVVVQTLGAAAGAALIRLAIPDNKIGSFGMTLPAAGVTNLQAVLVEALITFVLVSVVQGATDPRRTDLRGSAPLAIGLSVTACVAAAGSLTGASINPARSFGPALVLGNWTSHWVYWVGPLAGGLASGLVYRLIFSIGSAETGSYDL